MRIVAGFVLAGGVAAIAACVSRPAAAGRLRVALSYPASAATTALDGRLSWKY